MRRRLAAGAALLLLGAAPDSLPQGVALYRAGQFGAAAAAFRASASPLAKYDLGDALARAGDYKAAVEAFDAALARDPADADARANRALLTRLLAARAEGPPTTGRSGAGGIKSASDAAAPRTPVSNTGAEGFIGTRQSRSTAMASGRATIAPPRALAPDPAAGGAAESRGAAAAGAGRIGRGGDLAPETPADAATRILRAPERERRQATEQWIATIRDDPKRLLRLRFALEQRRRIAAGTAPPAEADPW